ncbi:MAG TPA: hypothetical protein VD836_11030, partial [Solirubrobacteraceae bacterium]|nr:hypothetical protein [Solirubrobacteraceae bacterium]
MRRSRRSPPPTRTPEEREAARLEREARRASRPGGTGPAPPADPVPAEPAPVPAEPAPAGAEPAAVGAEPASGPRARTPSGRARNTAIFSVLTGLSRIAGLAREIVAAAYYGTGGAASAFTLAFQV